MCPRAARRNAKHDRLTARGLFPSNRGPLGCDRRAAPDARRASGDDGRDRTRHCAHGDVSPRSPRARRSALDRCSVGGRRASRCVRQASPQSSTASRRDTRLSPHWRRDAGVSPLARMADAPAARERIGSDPPLDPGRLHRAARPAAARCERRRIPRRDGPLHAGAPPARGDRRHDRANRRLSRALPCRRLCRRVEVRDLLSGPAAAVRGFADSSAAVSRRGDRGADRLDLHARLICRGFVSPAGRQ